MRKPKLLFVVTEDWYFVSHRLSLAKSAASTGFEVVLLTRCGALRPDIEQAGIRTLPFEFDRRGINPLRAIINVVRLARVISHEHPDIVHNVALKPVVLGGLACYLTRTRHVINAVAGLGFLFTDSRRAPLTAALVRRLLAVVGRRGLTIVQNPEDSETLVKVGVPAERILVMSGVGVDLQLFRQTPEPEGTPIVALAARLIWDKGLNEFVEAARILRVRGTAVRCVLIGSPDDGNPMSVTTKQLDAWVAEGAIEWWGHRSNMAETLSSVHIVCLPTYYREGFPKILAEAAACGRPIVATDAPGCRSAVSDGENGILVPPRDPVRLASAIAELATNGERRRQLGAAGRVRAEREFSVESATAEMLDTYKSMLGVLTA